MNRKAIAERNTSETNIRVSIDLDGSGKQKIDTGVKFFDHMLSGFARHGLFDLEVSCQGDLEIDCFSTVCHYKAIGKKELMYNKNVSEKVQAVSRQIEQAEDENEIFKIITDFYKAYGVGMFGLNKAFRIKAVTNGVEFLPVMLPQPWKKTSRLSPNFITLRIARSNIRYRLPRKIPRISPVSLSPAVKK